MELERFLQENYNYNPDIKNSIEKNIKLWKALYEGNAKDYREYTLYNGQRKVKKMRYTLNMPKEISEDWSDIIWSEKCAISLGNEKSQEDFNKLSKELCIDSTINQAIEKSGALGTSAVVISVYDIVENKDGMSLDVSNAKTRTDIVDIEWVYPLTWNNKEITECAFGSVQYIKGKKYIVLSVHKLNDKGNYVIYNHLFLEQNKNITEIEFEDTMKEFDTGSNVKWFSIFKPLLTNNLFNNSPFGIPHYANAIDSIKAVDLSFDALKNEVKDSKRRIFVRASLLNYDNGQQTLTFDPEDTDIYVLPKDATKDDLIQSDVEDLRTDKQIEALNTNLNILGNKVGFGENHYHFDGTNLSTATAVVSSNSKLFRRKKKLEIGYTLSIEELVKAVCYASTKYGTYNIDFDEISIQFDDSIIEDKEAESVRALREVNAGLISREEYREKIFGETKEIAKKNIKEIDEEEPTAEELAGIDKNITEEE